MSARQIVASLFIAALVGGTAVGCGDPDTGEPLVAYVDSLYTLDLTSGHQTSIKTWDEGDLGAIESVFIDGCSVSAGVLPENAWLEDLTLIWLPNETQLGSHALALRYSEGCENHLTLDQESTITITVLEPWSQGETVKYEQLDSVHDLE